MLDILLVSVPIATKDPRPLAAIFHLRSALEAKGFKVACLDGNKFSGIDALLVAIDQYEFKWLGISVLTFYQIDEALEIGREFENVVYGGPGVDHRWDEANWIQGEGEHALVEFLNGNLFYPGINGRPPVQIEDINSLPAPNYKGHDYTTLTLTGSRGCVRKCSFCNVPDMWKKFKYVDGEVLAKQMIKVMKENPKAKEIFFSDSLVNGSDKDFKKMCNYLIDNNINIPWIGQFIIRKKPQEYFDMVVKSGGRNMQIGIESVSERVRYTMNKKIKDKEMYDNIDGLLKAGIDKLVLMFIVGYHTETEEDFDQNFYFMNRYKDYAHKMLLSPSLMSFIEDTPAQRETGFFRYRWENENSTLVDRIKRYIKFLVWIDHFGYLTDDVMDVRINNVRELVSKEEWDELYECAMREARDKIRVGVC